MQRIRRLLGADLLWSDGLPLLAKAEQKLLADVPKDCEIIRRDDNVLGALVVTLASGCRVIVQYDFSADKLVTYMDIQYQPMAVIA